MEKVILHIDLNAFFVRCEEIKNPTLVDKATIIGHQGRGGIVSTCSYKARSFGVRSGMPTYKATILCPEAILLPGDYKFYEKKSNEFFEIALRPYKEGNYASAIEYCNRAIDFYHNSPQIAKLKAMSYEKELNYRGAVKYYQQYLAMSPDASDKQQIEAKISQFMPKSN